MPDIDHVDVANRSSVYINRDAPVKSLNNWSKDANENMSVLTEPEERLTFHQREVENRYKDLPASQESEGNIKFLGSSYSGVDIKVIAHLYDVKNWNETKLQELNRKLAISKDVVDACSNLINGGLTSLAIEGSSSLDYDTKRDAFLAAAGFGSTQYISNPDYYNQEAKNIVLSSVWNFSNYTFMGVARMKQRAENLRKVHEGIVTEYEQRVEHVQSLGSVDSSTTVTLGTLQTISVQSFREKNAVRALGHAYAKSYTRGTRTIGGSCIFTIFNEHVLSNLIRTMGNVGINGERDSELSTLLPDQLPPLDLTIVFANEYGSLSDFRLYGVEFFTDGSVFSIEDLLSEQTMNFVCRDADIMTSRGKIRISRLQRGMFNDKDDKDLSGSSLLFDNQSYYEYLDKLGVRRRLTNR